MPFGREQAIMFVVSREDGSHFIQRDLHVWRVCRMDDERDVVVFEDDAGNEITMEGLDYLCYEGKEYALLAELAEEDSCAECTSDDCEGCASQREAFIMEVHPLPDDMEEFLPVDEALAEKLIDIFENSDFDEIFEDDEDENL